MNCQKLTDDISYLRNNLQNMLGVHKDIKEYVNTTLNTLQCRINRTTNSKPVEKFFIKNKQKQSAFFKHIAYACIDLDRVRKLKDEGYRQHVNLAHVSFDHYVQIVEDGKPIKVAIFHSYIELVNMVQPEILSEAKIVSDLVVPKPSRKRTYTQHEEEKEDQQQKKTYKNKHPSQWNSDESLQWMHDQLKRYGINNHHSSPNLHRFAVNGETLLRFNGTHFSLIDPIYGSLLYADLHENVNVSYIL